MRCTIKEAQRIEEGRAPAILNLQQVWPSTVEGLRVGFWTLRAPGGEDEGETG